MNGDLLLGLESWMAWPGVELFGWALIHFLWQGTIVALVIGALLFTLRHAHANTRYVVACAGLLVMAACPAATLAWKSQARNVDFPIVQQPEPLPTNALDSMAATF